MFRTNSKQARENLKNYIMQSWNIEEEDQGRTWKETQKDIIDSFNYEAYSSEYERRQNRQEAFKNWLLGLPRNLGDFCLCNAVKDLGDILEETEEERARFTEDQAEEKISALIYTEVFR